MWLVQPETENDDFILKEYTIYLENVIKLNGKQNYILNWKSKKEFMSFEKTEKGLANYGLVLL